MPSRTLETEARRLWLQDALDRKFGRCSTCDRVRGEDGRPLLVARQRGRRGYECLRCFDTGAEPSETPNAGWTLRPCGTCGLSVIHTGDGKHPCSFCGAPLNA